MSDRRHQLLHVKLPLDLHTQLSARAADQGVSLNQLVVSLLAGGVRFRLKKPPKRAPKPNPLPPPPPPTPAELNRQMKELERELSQLNDETLDRIAITGTITKRTVVKRIQEDRLAKRLAEEREEP